VAVPVKKSKHQARPKEQGADAVGKRTAARKHPGGGVVWKKHKQAKKPSRQEMSREVSRELLKLRPVLRGVGSALLDRLDGELAGLAASLDGKSLHGDVPALPEVAVLFAMLADIQALKVKPKKGRLKDLRRVEALLESLSALIPPEA
jgi:hypothetical protein